MVQSTVTVHKPTGRERVLKALVALVYVIPFLAVAFITVILAISPLISSKSLNGVMYGLLISALLIVLYFGEGSEISVTRLLDRDDEQLETHPGIDMSRIRWVRREYDNFATGRQIIVVLCVIALTATCSALADASHTQLVANREPGWMVPIARADFADLYTFLFPALGVLVAAQIPSKWRAQRRPMASWLSGFTQFVVLSSIVVGQISFIGFVLRGVGRTEKEADPSRLLLYRALAAFRDGLGFEQIDIDLIINPEDGSVEFTGTFLMKAYGAQPSARIPQEDGWDAEILNPVLEVVTLPDYCGTASVIGPIFGNQQHTQVHWDLAFAHPLKPHDSCVFRVKYKTGAGTMKIEPGKTDFFSYQTEKFPANSICVDVRLKSTKAIALREAVIEVEASREQKANIRESERVSRNIEPLPDGYRYQMRYPLMSAKYKFAWEVGSPLG